MGPGELYMYINDKLWELEWCRNDYFETQQILQEMKYAIGSLKV